MNECITRLAEATSNLTMQIEEMCELEHVKRKALLEYKLDEIEKLSHTQQAYTMKLEALEKVRLSAQNEAGYENLTMTEVLASVTKEEKAFLLPHFEKLALKIGDLKTLSKTSTDIAGAELRLLGADNVPVQTSTGGMYSASGQKKRNVTGTYSSKI